MSGSTSTSTRSSYTLLPEYLQTDKNKKFLSSTLDQLIQPAVLDRLDGYVGSKLAVTYDPATDTYIDGGSVLRNAYQLDPSLILNDANSNVTAAYGFDDLINQIQASGGITNNINRLFSSTSYSYDPYIDWDKFVNYNQYYWVPTGPDSITITGPTSATVSTYSVADSSDGNFLIFTPDGLTPNPLLTLYRGMTYVFNVNSKYDFYIKTAYVTGEQYLYSNVTGQGTSDGQVILTIDDYTPDILFYFAEGNATAVGQFTIQYLVEDSTIDVDSDIVGKATYTTGDGLTLSNGMKVHFEGNVLPSTYLGNDYIVEGVGTAIVLINFANLSVSGIDSSGLSVGFDDNNFDQYPFDDFSNVPLTPDYITINRAAPDGNMWSRYNRWVHQDVLQTTANENGVNLDLTNYTNAQRPIIEFKAGMKLFNYGTTAKQSVNLIDNITTNAIKSFNGSYGFYVDGIQVENGYRVIFNVDTDPLVQGKIFVVNNVSLNGITKVSLQLAEDSDSTTGASVITTMGNNYAGYGWWWNGTNWTQGQQRSGVNQAPLFDVFDKDGISFSDTTAYNGSFAGTKVFGYTIGDGTDDSILGFPLVYQTVANVGDYQFSNYFMTDTFDYYNNETPTVMNIAGNYLQFNINNETTYADVWVEQNKIQAPIVQINVIYTATNYVEITCVDDPGYVPDLKVTVLVNGTKIIQDQDYNVVRSLARCFIVYNGNFAVDDVISLNVFTSKSASSTGWYAEPEILTNNPLNGPIEDFTFTELSNHVQTMIENDSSFSGTFPGDSNLRDISDPTAYGSRLVTHETPLSFAHYFHCDNDSNLITAIREVCNDYNVFKQGLMNQVINLVTTGTASLMLDNALNAINANKNSTFPYNYSDMLGYGIKYVSNVYTVTNSTILTYGLNSTFDTTELSERSVLIYLNNSLLVKDRDYTINQYLPNFTLDVELNVGDVISVRDYSSTVGSYIPSTPTKLGIYPKFTPMIFVDNTYASGPQTVIQGHDGSLTVSYGDYRDDVLLEFETRIYNNLKCIYNADAFDYTSVIPGAFRNTDYSKSEITQVYSPDFIKWTGFFGVDYSSNSTFDASNPWTYNYSGTIDVLRKRAMPGFWRGIYRYFYDTDRPHTNPWEMLGFSEIPDWWENTYGPAPYTSGNQILWNDLEAGNIAGGTTPGINSIYARPGLSSIVPVDEYGNLLNPCQIGLITLPVVDPNASAQMNALRSNNISNEWMIGDLAPPENAWRRSSYWPFVMQILMALTKPAIYCSTMFDPSRLVKNLSGQYRYVTTDLFLDISDVSIYEQVVNNVRTLSSGYIVFVVENGNNQNGNYLTELTTDLTYLNYNLMCKLGGFANKDKLDVTIDAVDPTSPEPGLLVASEDYTIFFNKSSPVLSIGISGMIIQITDSGYSIRGYDKYDPYFTIYQPIATVDDKTLIVGGTTSSYSKWAANTVYTVGQIVFYLDKYYTVKTTINSGSSFETSYYQALPYLPQTGGVVVTTGSTFDTVETMIPYGTTFSTVQDVYDFIVGYGAWLEDQGFEFDEFNKDLSSVLNWDYSAKEFLYWTTQNWGENSVITISPFANQVTFSYEQGVVDNILNGLGEYSLLKADGTPFPSSNFTVSRLDGVFTLKTKITDDGIYFAKLNVVQKEHVLVINNTSIFSDVIYDIETGYRQMRLKLTGFRTGNWNGDFFSPGFVYDQATIVPWQQYTDYDIGTIVSFSGKYYTADVSVTGTSTFTLSQWTQLPSKPEPTLMPNFDYVISQFQDYYSLDIDNFDASIQSAAQNLTGYTPRTYLNNIIGDATAQYKFYQGYIREKGTKNPLIKLSKSNLNNLQNYIDFNEEWAFRIGSYGGYNTYEEFEFELEAGSFTQNPQIISFVQELPSNADDMVYYQSPDTIVIQPDNFDVTDIFPVTTASIAFTMPYAGYVRIDDITATVYNQNSLMDIENNQDITVGSTLWMGFTPNNSWDVLRYTKINTNINAVAVFNSGVSLIFTTSLAHTLRVGDLVSIVGVASTIDTIYLVSQIVSNTQFIVSSTLKTLPTINSPLMGLLYKFNSSHLGSMDDLYTIPYLDQWKYGELIWVDDDGTGNWVVNQKTSNFTNNLSGTYGFTGSSISQPSHFGTAIAVSTDTISSVITAPNYTDSLTGFIGRAFVMYRNGLSAPTSLISYTLNDSETTTYYNTSSNVGFGSSVFYDSLNGIIGVSAPLASSVKKVTTGTVVVNYNNSANSYTNQGVVKLVSLDLANQNVSNTLVITTPSPTNNSKFGSGIAYSSVNTVTNLLVTSIGDNGSKGAIYSFLIDVNTLSSSIQYVSSATVNIANIGFGTKLSASNNFDIVAVTAPSYSSGASSGAIYVFNKNLSLIQTITGSNSDLPSIFLKGDTFGSVVTVSNDGSYIFIGSPGAYDPSNGAKTGLVDVYGFNTLTNLFNFVQRIDAPGSTVNSNFGHCISISTDSSMVAVSSIGNSSGVSLTFDMYSVRMTATTATSTFGSVYVNDPTSTARTNATTFDSNGTSFTGVLSDSGSVYTYYKFGNYWTYGQQIVDDTVTSGTFYGSSLALTTSSLYIGAPATKNEFNAGNGATFIFDMINATGTVWSSYRQEDQVVDLTNFYRAVTVDTTIAQYGDYIDIIDPIKGKILGIAKEEIKFFSGYDPAIYSIGTGTVSINVNNNWLDKHVGQLWWDLSTVKYMWYEQGELQYRQKYWNGIFPGSSIDVYEWVSSSYLPSQWSTMADTASGLSLGMSGQPKYPDNTCLCVKQVYNSSSNSFSNQYYYWVKNKATIPNVKNRRQAAINVAQQIANPLASGNQFVTLMSPTSVMIANMDEITTNDQINMNISFNTIGDAANRHTEWLILQENEATSQPNWLLNQKLSDSLLGHDVLGNPVPDPSLTYRTMYGIGVRPRQTMFVDRHEALRNLVEFSNEVLASEIITGNISFDNLNMEDQVPSTSTFDISVTDSYTFNLINTSLLSTAQLSPVISDNGVITGLTIDDSGYGYDVPPTMTISVGTGANITLTIDEYGQVNGYSINDGGSGYTTATSITCRPFTVVVQSDSNTNGKWAVYQWNDTQWVKSRTQDFNTTLYWDYVDWVSTTYNTNTVLTTTVPAPYDLYALSNITEGQYVKVQNSGDGNYMILQKTDGSSGTFDDNWNILYSENGTIQISDDLWSQSNTLYAFDGSAYDLTEYDETPDKEIYYIIQALHNDIFTGTNAIYWNQLFFKMVRYALTEQTFIDWAFKTAFINVTNYLGSLDQRKTYQLLDSTNYQEFLEEIKPYHTTVRQYTDYYTTTDYTETFVTDFDLPAYYNTLTNNFNKVQFGNTMLLQQPWNSWYQNYGYEVESIDVYYTGTGYYIAPNVSIVAAPGDSGFGAKAVAYISNGSVSRVLITDPGQNYCATPTAVFSGGTTSTNYAKAYVHLGSSTVRTMSIDLKFDRVNVDREIGNMYFTDTFTGNGYDNDFDLTWVPVMDYNLITVTINGVLQLIEDFTITTSESLFYPQKNTSYIKKYATLSFMDVPDLNDSIVVLYPKNLMYYKAVDRIQDYYNPTVGMAGTQTDQLMIGVTYPGLQIDTIGTADVGGFDIAPFGGDFDVYTFADGYEAYNTTSTNTQTFYVTTELVSTGTEVNVYANGVRIDGTSTYIMTPIGVGYGCLTSPIIVAPGSGYISTQTAIFVSAPDLENGVQAIATWTISGGALTSIGFSEIGSGYINNPTMTVLGTYTVKSYVSASVGSGFVNSSTTATYYGVTIPEVVFTTTSTLIVFRYATDSGAYQWTDPAVSDSFIDAGNTAYTTALGVLPSEIIFDGGSTSTRIITGMLDDGFLNPIDGYAPEELVQGQIHESIGISVFTQPQIKTPLMVLNKYDYDGTTSTYNIPLMPANNNGLMIILNDSYVDESDYSIDYVDETVTVNSTLTGLLSITSMQMGSYYPVDSIIQTVTTSNMTVTSVVAYSDVESVYVTQNGIDLVENTDYTVSNNSGSYAVTFVNTGVSQIFLFDYEYQPFSRIVEQTFVTEVETSTNQLTLDSPIGFSGPLHNQVILTKNGARMTPPNAVYYMVENGQTVYSINGSITYPPKSVNISQIEVYHNGVKLTSKWIFNQNTNNVTFSNGTLSNGDVIAISILQNYDYTIYGYDINLTQESTGGDTYKVTTFANHDPDFIRTNVYNGNMSNEYLLARPTLNAAYVWVTYNGVPLTSELDYIVSGDGTTVLINSSFYNSPSDVIIITSFADMNNKLISFRMFKDMLGRTHYKRLSESTVLTQPLLSTSTTITVEDASVLSMPSIATNKPGVVLIDGERIEFFIVNGNVLSQLRRATLGTGMKSFYPMGIEVIDQGVKQTIPFSDSVTSYKFTMTNTTTYFISSLTLTTLANAYDQVEVLFGGTKLLKPGLSTVTHNYDLSYDSTSTSDTTVPAGFDISISTSSSSTAILILNQSITTGTIIEVIHRTSTSWYDSNETLYENGTDFAQFLTLETGLQPG